MSREKLTGFLNEEVMMAEMYPVFSSHVSRVGYDADARELHIEWQKGRRSVYTGVPPEVGIDFHKRPSIGGALQEVKGTYEHRYA